MSIRDSEELRAVRVYTKKYNSKDKNGKSVEKESKQKQVSLKKEDPFEDNELVKVLTREEYEELTDAVNQGSKVMEICEMCDLIGAIKSYAFTQYNLTLGDLIQFLEKTESAFKDGTRR